MKDVILCNHTGSFNRGCDAIVKSTADLFREIGMNTILAEHHKKEDHKFGVAEFSDIIEYAEFSNAPISRSLSLLYGKLMKNEQRSAYYRQQRVWKRLENSIGLNVGGDTYCYRRADRLPSMMLNQYCSQHNIPLVFWGCSVEKSVIEDPETWDDLSRYRYICPRESITMDRLICSGIPEGRILFVSDPAFTLRAEKATLPEGFLIGNTVGVNLSPLVMSQSGSDDLLIRNYSKLIQYVLKESSYNVVLIPHVYHANNYNLGDLLALSQIKKIFENEHRVILLEDFYTAKQLKYIISQCVFLITARTHASIAAYSSYVPTLVLGYSVKAQGIAMDLFGETEHYVKQVQKIREADEMLNAFRWLMDNEGTIKKKLKNRIPEAIGRTRAAVEKISQL